MGDVAEGPFGAAARLMPLITGYMVSQAIGVAAELGIADLLSGGPRSVSELAEDSGTNPDALYRVLRALASYDIFAEDQAGQFALTPMGELLRSDIAGSLRSFSLVSSRAFYRVWQEALYSVRTGEPTFDHLYGRHHFEWLAQEPAEAELFDRAMTGAAASRVPVLLGYDWSVVSTVVDVGGGNGALLSALLSRFPHLRGTLIDLPHTLNRALDQLAAAGVSDRAEAIGGNFFDAVPPGADRYVLAKILHDWNDEDSVRILRSCRRAIPAAGSLLVLEHVVPEENTRHPAKLQDLQMLVMNGGRERTAPQWRELLAAGGFRLSDVKESPQVCLLEAQPL